MEYRTIQITTNELNTYFDYITTSYKNMYNVANFYIRNCMTGIKKEPHKRTNNETEVLADIFNNIRSLNEIKINNWIISTCFFDNNFTFNFTHICNTSRFHYLCKNTIEFRFLEF